MRRSTILTGFGVAVAAASVFSGAGLAIAGSGGIAPSADPEAAGWYTEAQIEDKWDAIVVNYPEALPAGVTFPADAPPFFHPEEETVFEEGLAETIAGRFWRCAWLDDSLTKAADGASRQAERSADVLDNFEDTPDAGVAYDVEVYEKAVQEVAENTGVSPEQAEFDMDCGDLVYPKGVQK